MDRDKLQDLILWEKSTARKPLIIRGARQVGKTWLMKEFGRTQYKHTVYVNFEKNKRLKDLFAAGFDIKRVILALQAESGQTIAPEDTLLIFDEIQALPYAITALKYFYEDANEYHVVAAGSLLGMALHSGTSFPVGSVAFLDLHPLTFKEFLVATGEKALVEMLSTADWKLITAFKHRYIERLKHYYYTGGMPEAVNQFVLNGSFTDIREIHHQILDAYEQDFSKHTPYEIAPRIRMVWNSIPAQLSRENRKFIYGIIKKGARSRDYELALAWLTDCGHVQKVYRVNKPGYPLKAYEDMSAFKLFLVDIGLLGAMGEVDARILVDRNTIFSEFKGALTEQYVLQQLLALENMTIYYWSAERATAEVDFLTQYGDKIIPVEVKAEENLQAKSLKSYMDKFDPLMAIRTSMSDYYQRVSLRPDAS
jgi:predicted AAA+ superfamily ATPase